jgi:xanthine dehydrogenase accessory factor
MRGRAGGNIYETTVRFIDSGVAFAACVVLESDGSTPAKAGWRAVVESDGRIHGTLGGGRVELSVQEQAVESCRSGEAAVVECVLEGTSADGAQPICGGRIRILTDPQAGKSRDAYVSAAQTMKERGRGVLVTRIRRGEGIEVESRFVPEGSAGGDTDVIAGGISDCLGREKGIAIVDGGAEVFFEPVVCLPVLLIAGGGHVGQAVARQAREAGFEVVVFDEREEFARAELFGEGVKTICGDAAKGICDYGPGAQTYVVIVTPGHQHDQEVLEACIGSAAAYVGMIGSRRKVEMIRRSFIESKKATEEQWGRVFAPIGLDIGAVTAGEIATSIVGQLIAVRRKGRDCCNRGAGR